MQVGPPNYNTYFHLIIRQKTGAAPIPLTIEYIYNHEGSLNVMKSWTTTGHLGVVSIRPDNTGGGNLLFRIRCTDPLQTVDIEYVALYLDGYYQTETLSVDNPYTFGFNTQMKNNLISSEGNHLTAQYWEYDPRLGRRWNLDPVYFTFLSRYAINSNNPNIYLDPNGDFRTKFGAQVYRFFHGGEIGKVEDGKHAGQYYVGKQTKYTGEGIGAQYDMKFNSRLSSVAEFARGTFSALAHFQQFANGGGGNFTYPEGSFENDEMASSPGVLKAIEKVKRKIDNGEVAVGSIEKFAYNFSPNPKKAISEAIAKRDLFAGFSKENKEAHYDAFNNGIFKLYVGGYSGSIKVVSNSQLLITINNKTTANSLMLHAGKLLGKDGEESLNSFWNNTPYFNTLTQKFEFTYNIPSK